MDQEARFSAQTAFVAPDEPRIRVPPPVNSINQRRLGCPQLLINALVGYFRIDVGNRGGLKGSMQHWLAVYPPEFQIPMFFVAVDSDAGRSGPGPTGSSRTDPPSSTGIA